MTAKQPAVKKYVVTLSADERDRLTAMIQKGKAPVRQVLKARILLKADASEAGDGWSDSRIAEALDTTTDTIIRTRQHLMEGGIDAALIRKHSPNSARKRIFDGEAENFFARIGQFRAIVTRYEQTARSFLAVVHLVASVVWLN